MSTYFVAVLEKNSEGRFFAFIPDMPGVTAAGATRAEALSFVTEFANDWIANRVEEKMDIPPARDFDDIDIEPDVIEIGRALIPVEIPGKSVKVTLSMDEAFLERVDRAAKDEGLTRSGYFVEAAGTRLRLRIATGMISGTLHGSFIHGGPIPAPERTIPGGKFMVTGSRAMVVGSGFLPVTLVPDREGHLIAGIQIGGDTDDETGKIKSGN